MTKTQFGVVTVSVGNNLREVQAEPLTNKKVPRTSTSTTTTVEYVFLSTGWGRTSVPINGRCGAAGQPFTTIEVSFDVYAPAPLSHRSIARPTPKIGGERVSQS